MRTIDNLANPDRREITTVFDTGIRVREGTYDAGTVRVALTTSHVKGRKRFETRLNREVLTDSGFITRSFALFAEPTADSGITLATEPTARFNATKARVLHGEMLAALPHHLAATHGKAADDLRDLLSQAVGYDVTVTV